MAKKKIVKTQPQANGTLLTYADGTTEFLEGVTMQLTGNDKPKAPEVEDDEEEKLLEDLRK